MVTLFTRENMWQGHYLLSPFASASYYSSKVKEVLEFSSDRERKQAMHDAVKRLVETGDVNLLPYRMGIIQGSAMASVKASGRGTKPLKAQLKAKFTQQETSVYKQYKPYLLQTGLWQVEGTQSYYYGTLGISDEYGKISRDNSDLVIIRTSDWKVLDVYVFRGLAGVDKQLDCLPEVMVYLKEQEGR